MNRSLNNRLLKLERSVPTPVAKICCWQAIDQLLPQLSLIARRSVGPEKSAAAELVSAYASRVESLDVLSVDALTLMLQVIEKHEQERDCDHHDLKG